MTVNVAEDDSTILLVDITEVRYICLRLWLRLWLRRSNSGSEPIDLVRENTYIFDAILNQKCPGREKKKLK